jgi:hypothetical protein
VTAIAVAMFLAAFATIFVRLAAGHDPALAAKPAARAAPAAPSTSASSAPSSSASSAPSSSSSASSSGSTIEPGPVTTQQS